MKISAIFILCCALCYSEYTYQVDVHMTHVHNPAICISELTLEPMSVLINVLMGYVVSGRLVTFSLINVNYGAIKVTQ